MKRVKKIMLLTGGILLLIIIILFITLYFLSPGKPKPLTDNSGNVIPNSISEKLFIEINGSEQGMFIKGVSADNPVLLFLHGGMPVYFLTEKYPVQLEKNFVVVWWEQRNCGISINSGTDGKKVTVDQLVDDTITLTKYLMKRFNKDKIFLMGHSGGTFPGIHVIDKAPELYHAYIGMAQMSDQLLSEKIAAGYMLDEYRKRGNEKMIRIFQRVAESNIKELPDDYAGIRDIAMHELGIGTMRNMKNLLTDLMLPSFLFSEYTLTEKFNLWMGKSKSGISQSWSEMIKTDLKETKNTFRVPVYFFHGIYDYTCSYELARQYFERIDAPVKGFYTFSESAHSPILEEPEKANAILVKDVLSLTTSLADSL